MARRRRRAPRNARITNGTDETCATPGTAQETKAGGNKAGSAATIRGLFSAAKTLLCGKDGDEPEPRRKSGETEGEFRRMALYLWRRFEVRQGFKTWSGITSRYVQPDPAAYAIATEYLASTLDALNEMNDGTATDYGDDYNMVSNFNSLHL
jgi:hypothetical protein